MDDYKEFTFGWTITATLVPLHFFNTYLYLYQIGTRPIPANTYIIISLILGVCYLLFFGMTTKITSADISISFGVGLIRKRIELSRITSAMNMKTPWYYGWGIRFIPRGMLYNISGSDCVELTFHDTTRVVRIGTKDPLRLKTEIGKRLSHAN